MFKQLLNTARSTALALAAPAVAAAIALAGPATAAPAEAAAETAIVVADYTVFVDPPTGFVFVKLPAGWKFVGKVDDASIAKLPGTVVTALLKADGDTLMARR